MYTYGRHLPRSHPAQTRRGPEPPGQDMREEFQSDLNEISRLLVTMAEAVRAAMRKATSALLTADLKAAESVIERDAEVDAIYSHVEAKVADNIARQAPVAVDLRMVITALHISADLERMGDLAEHVAKTAARRHPSPAVPAERRSEAGRGGKGFTSRWSPYH